MVSLMSARHLGIRGRQAVVGFYEIRSFVDTLFICYYYAKGLSQGVALKGHMS